MKAKETVQETMVTAADFAKELSGLVREQLVGLVQAAGEQEFVFTLPGGVKAFRVCVTEEKTA